jgi:predicted outer membrane repeat protein
MGGGMVLHGSPGATLRDCAFIDNTAEGLAAQETGTAGGIFCVVSSVPMTDCTFIGNRAIGGDYTLSGKGGAIWSTGSSPTLTNCAFIGNEASAVSSEHSGVAGGFGCSEASNSMTLTNCTFIGNTASSAGGGMYAVALGTGPIPKVTNCTFSANTAGGGAGGAISSSGELGGLPGITLNNCIVWGNGPSPIVDELGAVTTINHSDVQGGWPGLGSNNIDEDPLFVDAGDVHLAPGSPCIDAGNNIAVPPGVDTDLDGNPRFVDQPYAADCPQAPGQCGDPPIVDMGAYELCLWDCGGDHDGVIGIVDFLALLAQWGQQGATCDFGLGDPGVGINEFLDLLAAWGSGCAG